jgi:beta-N-acetylhexosaminidase
MRISSPIHRHNRVFYTSIAVVFCCFLLFLSACTDPIVSANDVPAPQRTEPAVSHSVTPVPTLSPAQILLQKQQRKVQQILQGMTLDQKLGQLIIVEYIGTDYAATGLQQMVAQQFVGGFMYQESNNNFDAPYNTIANVNALSQQAQTDARIPLLIATDQEGGLVNRLYQFHGYLPSAQEMAASGTPATALNQGTQAAQWMLQLGINADLAPVVDVHTVDPPILETRMFGSDPKTVATYAGAFLNGLQKNGVIGTLKHFPGLGAITSDPHAGLPTVTRSKADLEAIDLAPYKTMIPQDHPAMIMSTDVLTTALDATLPAELSPKVIDGVLRKELGYNGVVITDGLYMGGISATWTLSQAAVLAISAGNDLVEGPYTPTQVAAVVAALKQAMDQGQISMKRIDQSVQRILLMKMQYGIIK